MNLLLPIIMKWLRALLPVFLFLWITGSFFVPTSFAQNEQDLFVLEQAQAIFDELSAEERVGQLFLVYFEGSELSATDEILNLIAESNIGGVILQADNDNFNDSPTAPAELAKMVNGMQELALIGRSSRIESSESEEEAPSQDIEAAPDNQSETDDPSVTPLPIFIGIARGESDPTEWLPGLTQVPNQLALGATWNPEMAEITGEILGDELSHLGVNLLLAPSLNVVASPELLQQMKSDGLIDSFGGNAYWAGEFGRAFVQGIKNGSDNRLAVIGGDFPGSGQSDRPKNSELATVRTSLIDLQTGDMAPFFKLADTVNLSQTIDGFQTAHLRYQGFQGNIDDRSAPLSFDAQAIETLLQIEPLINWRSEGGLLVSGELGTQAIRRYYASEDDPFPHRRVARDSLLAGNDMLYVGYFAAEDDVTLATENVRDTLTWFTEQYNNDSTFRSRVDEAVLRILQTKVQLYGGDFSLSNVLIDEVSVADNIGIHSNVVDMIAHEAIAQLAPRPQENPEPLPRQPSRDDTIVIFTDARPQRFCPSCDSFNLPAVTGLEAQILQLYGPDASNQVDTEQILSFSFEELEVFLDAPRPILAPTPVPITSTEVISEPVIYPDDFLVLDALNRATWVVFATQGVREDIPASAAMNRLFAEQPEAISGRIVTVFSMGYPIDLDATDMSRVTAYYGLFSPGEASLDGAARVLFRDLPLRGASPLSIRSIGYDLDQVTSARPSQVIELTIEQEEEEGNGLPPERFPGDTLRLRTGVILDYNGKSVPDGTLVQFTQEDRVQGFYSVIAEVFTVDGRASFDYVLEDRAGQFRLRASSGSAIASDEVDIVILENDAATIEVITPTPAPTATPTQTPIPTATPTPTPSLTPVPSPTPVPVLPPEEPTINITLTEIQTLGSLILGLFGVGWLGNLTRSESHPLSGRIRKILWGLLFGLIGYIWFLTDMPGSQYLPEWGVWRWMLVTIACGIPGIGLAWLFNQVFDSE